MVFKPGGQRGPTVVDGVYIVSPKSNVEDAARDIQDLIAQEKAEKTASIANKSKYLIVLHCDAAFAEKVKKLSSVEAVEQSQVVYAQKRRAGGPGIGM